MMQQTSITRSLQNLFRDHPVGFPLCLLLVGTGLLGWTLFAADTTGLVYLPMGLFAVMAILGAVLLPVGLIVTVRRRRKPQVLRCVRCGAESRQCAVPFRVERISYVNYAHVVCSKCGADFTVDKDAALV